MGRSGKEYRDRDLSRKADRNKKFSGTVREIQPRQDRNSQPRRIERDVANGDWHQYDER